MGLVTFWVSQCMVGKLSGCFKMQGRRCPVLGPCRPRAACQNPLPHGKAAARVWFPTARLSQLLSRGLLGGLAAITALQSGPLNPLGQGLSKSTSGEPI